MLGFWEIGGWTGLVEAISAQPTASEDYFRLMHAHTPDTEYPWTGMVFSLGIVMSTGYYVGNQAVMQRALGARTEWDAKAGVLTAGVFKMMIPVLVFIPGMIARALVPEMDQNDAAIPMLINKLMPAGLKGFGVCGFLCSIDVER